MPDKPFVSCIMPTYNRRRYVPLALQYFLHQDYPHKELIIIDDGTDPVGDLVADDRQIRYLRLDKKKSIGSKRNIACKEAFGEIIVHWDDDDWSAPWRLSYQIAELIGNKTEICGLDKIIFFNKDTRESWQYIYPTGAKSWLAGGTLCYTKAFWSRTPFPDISEGEDTRFLWNNYHKKILALPNFSFYVALIHPENTSPKKTSGHRWHKYSTEEVIKAMGDDWKSYANLNHRGQKMRFEHRQQPKKPKKSKKPLNDFPLVSCILPTYNRRHYFPQAVKYFLRQDYPNKELIVVDDGRESVGDLIPKNPSIRYIRLQNRRSPGIKRNIGCEASKGEIIFLWDDDDWYAPNRITYQVEPLLNGESDITGLGKGLFFSLTTRRFWTTTDELHARMFFQEIVSGTMAYWKRLWSQGFRYPDALLADDAAFLRTLVKSGIHLTKLDNDGVFVYVRHNSNTWRFDTGSFLDRKGWREVPSPSFMPGEDLAFYGANGNKRIERSQGQNRPRKAVQLPKPLVSCILATDTRRPFLKQAVKYFQRQTYENKELIIIDDGLESYEKFFSKDKRIHYIKLNDYTPLGSKLNIGIKASNGKIIQKLDDDDYYHPEFLDTTVSALLGHNAKNAVVGCDCFMVLIVKSQQLKFSGYGWCAGGTLCFYKQLWENSPFRKIKNAVDWWFLKDHLPQRIKIRNPELYVHVRHNFGHLWTNMSQKDVTDYFHNQTDYSKTMKSIFNEEDLKFYQSLPGIEYKTQNYQLTKTNGDKKMTPLEKIKGPDKEGREAMYYAESQDAAYKLKAYDYLSSIAMAPRLAVMAMYVKAFGLRKVLDVGCGTGNLAVHLDSKTSYIGVDISHTAIETAKKLFNRRKKTSFYAVNFRNWKCPVKNLDGLVWAGIGCTWTRKGRGGSSHDWLEILELAEQYLKKDGILILELVTGHWPSLERLVVDRYDYLAGCDIDCFQSEESPKRSIRVLKKKVN